MADDQPAPAPAVWSIVIDSDDEYRATLIRRAARELHLEIVGDGPRFTVRVKDAEQAYRFGLASGFALNGEEKP